MTTCFHTFIRLHLEVMYDTILCNINTREHVGYGTYTIKCDNSVDIILYNITCELWHVITYCIIIIINKSMISKNHN
jgi:hypothetical protein